MANGGLNFLVFLGSVREGRLATRVGKYVQNLLEQRNHKVTILGSSKTAHRNRFIQRSMHISALEYQKAVVTDPKELGLAQVIQPLHFHKNPADAPEILHKINKQIKDADGYVVVSPEYNSCIGPALTSLMDHFPITSYSYRPSAIVTYSAGQLGGIRAAMQLRQYLSELTTVHMSSMIVVSNASKNLDENGAIVSENKDLAKSSEKAIKQFEWYANVLKKGRKENPV